MLKIDVMAALTEEVNCSDPPIFYSGCEGRMLESEEDYDDDEVFEPEELIVRIPLDKIRLNRVIVH